MVEAIFLILGVARLWQHSNSHLQKAVEVMNIRQLKALITQGESETLEFKTSTAQLKSACETLCGFLNAKGGIVLIGIGSKGQIIGQHVTYSTHQEIANELRKIEPPVSIRE